LVWDALHDVAAAAGLSDAIGFWSHGMDIFRGRGDLFCLCAGQPNDRDGAFVGAVYCCDERAAGNALTDASVHADALDMLLMLAGYHATQVPLVIVSTYARWRIFWLPKDFVDAGQRAQSTAGLPCADVIGLCASPCYRRDDVALVNVLAVALLRMSRDRSLVDAAPEQPRLSACVGPLIPRPVWLCVDRESPTSGPSNPRSATPVFVLTHDLGAGADGRAWKARRLIENPTIDGVNADDALTGPRLIPNARQSDIGDGPLVIKFGHALEDADKGKVDGDVTSEGGSLWRESILWERVWGVQGVRTVLLCGRPALVMPYARPVAANADQARQLGIVDAVLSAVDRMAKAGVCHDDLDWRHVGAIRDDANLDDAHRLGGGIESEERIVFFDLARVSIARPHKAATRMRRALGLPP
jgi:hypothetical protein